METRYGALLSGNDTLNNDLADKYRALAAHEKISSLEVDWLNINIMIWLLL